MNDLFDNHLSYAKRRGGMFKLAFVAWLISAAVSIGLVVAVVWVAYHFIQKYW